jgi:hypothetical protein
MKKIALLICSLSIVAFSFGQSAQADFDHGKMQFNVGVGLSTWGIPFYVGADYWITEDITLGLEASFRYRFLHTYRYGYFGGSINANYHFARLLELPDYLDVYAGFSAGPYIGFGSYYTGGSFNFGIGAQVGGRYKINDKLWVNAELGGGSLSGGKIGITLGR